MEENPETYSDNEESDSKMDDIIENKINQIIESSISEIHNKSNNNTTNDSSNDSSNNEQLHLKTNEEIQQNVKEISSNYELSPETMQIFNKTLHQYLIIEEEIKVLRTAIKARNDLKANLDQILSTFLKKSTISHVKLNGTYAGKNLETVKKSTVVGVNKQVIVEILHDYFSDKPDIFEDIMSKISEKSKIKETTKIQIKSNKNYNKINDIEKRVNEVDKFVNDISDIQE